MRFLSVSRLIACVSCALLMGPSVGSGTSETGRSGLYFGLCSGNVARVEIVDDGKQGLPVMVFTLTTDAQGEFHKLTRENVGRQLDVVFDAVSLGKESIHVPVRSGVIVSREWRSRDAAIAFSNLVRDEASDAPCGRLEEIKGP